MACCAACAEGRQCEGEGCELAHDAGMPRSRNPLLKAARRGMQAPTHVAPPAGAVAATMMSPQGRAAMPSANRVLQPLRPDYDPARYQLVRASGAAPTDPGYFGPPSNTPTTTSTTPDAQHPSDRPSMWKPAIFGALAGGLVVYLALKK